MEYNVSSLLREHTGATREYPIDGDVKIDGTRRRVTGHVRMDRTPDGILVRAAMRSDVDVECSRCLRPVSKPVSIEFEEEFIPTVDVVTGAHVHPPDGREDAYMINARHVLDLQLAVQQYWGMVAPMAPLCRDDCPGLCPRCGADLASGDHSCTPTGVDDRWSKLAELTSTRP